MGLNHGLGGHGLIPSRKRDLSLLQSIQSRSGAIAASYSMGPGDSFSYSGQGVKLTTHLHLVLRLGMRPVFKASAGTSPLRFVCVCVRVCVCVCATLF